jgi:hypothetical protein
VYTAHGDCFISHTSYVDHMIKVMLLCNQVFKYYITVSPTVVRVVTCLLSRCLEMDLAIHTAICIYHLLHPKGSAHV